MNIVLNINSNAIAAYTLRLERTRRSALPNAVRKTLNAAALHVKQQSMPKSAKNTFAPRRPQFFKVASRVEFAKGYDIAQMKSAAGFRKIPNDPGGAVKDMKQQEFGGDIPHREFIALKGARSAKKWHRMVKKDLRMAALARMVDSDKSTGKTDKVKFTKAAIHAGAKGIVLGNRKNSKGAKTVYLINKVLRKGKNTVIGKTAIYSEKPNRKVKVKSTKFMSKAATESSQEMHNIFIQEATKEINRI